MASLDPDIRILLAAPSPRVRAAVKRVLIEAGARVQTVSDGDAAAQAAVDAPPDLLITLLDLPHIRGGELAQIARAASRTGPLPVVWLLPPSDDRPVPQSPLDAVLRLPFSASALTRTCRALLDAARADLPPAAEVAVAPPRPAWARSLSGEVDDVPEVVEVPADRLDFDLDLDTDDADDDGEMEVREVAAESIERPTGTGPVVAEGRLAEEPLGRLLIGAMETAFSGVLVIGHDEVEKRIHLRHGRPVYCESNLLMETLGEYLVHQGLLDRQALGQAAQRMIDDGIPQGEALVALGAITQEELADAMHFHVREKVVNCFAWDDADYRLEVVPPEAQRVLAVEMEPLMLVADGIRRFTAPQVFLRFLDSHLDDHPVPGPAFARHAGALAALAGGQRLARALTGQAPVAAIRAGCALDDLLFAQLLMSLDACGLVRLAAEPASTEVPLAAREDELIAEMETLTASPVNLDLEPAALTVEQAAVRDEVLAHYIALPHADPFTLLGASPDTNAADLAHAFAGKVALVGPDRLAGFPDPEVTRMGREVYLRLIEAYETLRRPEGRAQVLARLDERLARRAAREHYLEADIHYRAGVALLEEARPADAEEAFRYAGQLNRREPAYALYAGWAGYLAGREVGDPAAMTRGEAQVRRALEVLPILEDGWLFLARMAGDRGDGGAARDLAERALVFNPGNPEARALLHELATGLSA